MSRWPNKEAMRERILATADRLFYGQGIRAVGVDTVAAEIGISKRTLYNHFPSKDALVVAYLQRRFVMPEVTDGPPLDQILASFDRLERAFASERFRGCAFVNAVTEIAEADHEARRVAEAFKDARRAWYRDLLVRLGIGDPEPLSTQLALLVDGAIIGALIRGQPAVARAAKDAARVLVMHALDAKGAVSHLRG